MYVKTQEDSYLSVLRRLSSHQEVVSSNPTQDLNILLIQAYFPNFQGK